MLCKIGAVFLKLQHVFNGFASAIADKEIYFERLKQMLACWVPLAVVYDGMCGKISEAVMRILPVIE